MKGLTALVFIYLICFTAGYPSQVVAEENDGDLPPGMKIEKVGDLQIVVPKDAEVSRTGKGGLIKVEKSEEYLARKLLGMEERFDKLEAAHEALKKDVELLKEALDKLKSKNLISR